MSSDFSSALSIFQNISFFFFFSSEANSRTVRRTWIEKVPNVSLSLVSSVGCHKIPGDDQKSQKPGIISYHGSTDNCISQTTTQRGSDCKELTKRPSEDTQLKPSQDQAMADPTVELRQQLAVHGADKEKCNAHLGNCSGMYKEAN